MIKNKNNKIIAIDIDEVLSHLMPKVVDYFNNLHGTNYTTDKCDSYSWSKLFSIPKEQELLLYDSFIETGGLKSLDAVAGAVDGIKKIKGNNQLIITTSRALTLKNDTEFWLNKHFPNCFNDIIYLRETIFDPMLESKFLACQKANVDIFIEDDFVHLGDFAETKVKTLIMDRPWNQKDELPKNFKRVFSWDEIVDEINNY